MARTDGGITPLTRSGESLEVGRGTLTASVKDGDENITGLIQSA